MSVGVTWVGGFAGGWVWVWVRVVDAAIDEHLKKKSLGTQVLIWYIQFLYCIHKCTPRCFLSRHVSVSLDVLISIIG